MNNSSNIKRYIKKPMVALLVSLLLVISIPFSVYAEQLNEQTFNNQPLPTSSSNALVIGSTPYIYSIYQSSGTTPVYIFGYGTSGSRKVAVCSLGSGCSVTVVENNTTYQLNQYSSTTYGFYANDNIFTLPLENCLFPVYSTKQEGYSAVQYAINNPVVNSSGYTVIESGNIVYFELGNGTSYDIDLESQFYSNSGVISGTWSDDNRRYGFSSELPVADTNFGETAGTGILWTKSTKGQNVLGQTKIGDANITGTTTSKYLWIINPMYNNKYFEDSLDAKALNGLITVTGVPAGTTVYTYKLKQNASSIGLESTIPDVSGGTGTVSDTSGTQTTYVSTDDNETPYTQTVGGDNSAPEEVTATEGIRQTLDQLSNSFSTLFLAPVEYIQNLISSGSAFMQTLGGIFSWLPEPVVSVFLSALVLMIVIGVIKMLL